MEEDRQIFANDFMSIFKSAHYHSILNRKNWLDQRIKSEIWRGNQREKAIQFAVSQILAKARELRIYHLKAINFHIDSSTGDMLIEVVIPSFLG